MPNSMRILRITAVREITGLSRSTLYYLVKKKQFPPPVKIAARASGWIEAEVLSYIDSRRTARDWSEV
jgi:prophage regulatory protein